MTIAAATQSSSLLGVLPLFALLLAGAALIRWSRRTKAMVKPQLDQLEHELDLIRSQVLLVTTDDVPSFKIAKTLGYVEALSPTEAASDWEYLLAEKDALLRLAQKARDIGANAVVGIRKTNAHYDQAGSRWRVSRVTYCGTAVIREN
ncbi:heavy metal-binding domain-containing protein [Sideroxyarcus sp. TK5]